MKKVLIDTNIYSLAMRGDPETISILQRAHEIVLCSINIGELLSGFKGRRARQFPPTTYGSHLSLSNTV